VLVVINEQGLETVRMVHVDTHQNKRGRTYGGDCTLNGRKLCQNKLVSLEARSERKGNRAVKTGRFSRAPLEQLNYKCKQVEIFQPTKVAMK
jgi:hypothetical protein